MQTYVQVKRNETEYWGEEWREEHLVTKCLGIYVFAPEIHVHCCELTPSYELWPVRDELEFEPGTSEEDIERAEEEAVAATAWDKIIYIHCHSLDLSKTEEIGEAENAEDAVEAANANWV